MGPSKLAGGRGEGHDRGHLVGERVEVELPAGAAVLEGEALQEEGAQRRLGDVGGERGVALGAAGEGGEVERLHGADVGELAVLVGDRGHVGDDEAADAGGLGQGQHHRRLAAHGVAEDVGAAAVGGDGLGEVAGHGGVAVLGAARAVAVVAHVDGDDLAVEGEALGDGAPVPRRAEEAVGDEEGRVRGRARR